MRAELRHDWTLDEIEGIYSAPLTDLIFRAQQAQRLYHRTDEVQGCVLLSIKTGGCPEDCAYCPQSAHYSTDVSRQDLVTLDEMTDAAVRAKEQGAARFCMGGAWRDVPDGPTFDRVLEMVRVVRGLGMEACCTLGIIGMGEGRRVRCGLLQQLSALDPHPESVPINMLVRVDGTPLADMRPEDPLELVRTIATARILMPASTVRLSAGRLSLSDEAQALCFLAGANSIFLGERLLTTPNPGMDHDQRLLDKLGLRLTEQRDSGLGTRDLSPVINQQSAIKDSHGAG